MKLVINLTHDVFMLHDCMVGEVLYQFKGDLFDFTNMKITLGNWANLVDVEFGHINPLNKEFEGGYFISDSNVYEGVLTDNGLRLEVTL